jgi:hypothetical protein
MDVRRAANVREGDSALVLELPPRIERLSETEAFVREQLTLTAFNRERLTPGLGEPATLAGLAAETKTKLMEGAFVERQRAAIQPLLATMPAEPAAFMAWFENLRETGPGQNDPLFPWLAEHASLKQMRWFLEQEVAGEAGFEDLLALTQLKMPERAKLEMARNYWDEMGRGQAKGMHGPMLDRLAKHLELDPQPERVAPESLALANTMSALAFNRRYAYLALGALGIIELTAPGRAALVAQGLKRLSFSPKVRHYFTLHAVLDVRHAEAWNAEAIRPLVEEDPRRARLIAEGALIRLACGQKCFNRYRREFGLRGDTTGAEQKDRVLQ